MFSCIFPPYSAIFMLNSKKNCVMRKAYNQQNTMDRYFLFQPVFTVQNTNGSMRTNKSVQHILMCTLGAQIIVIDPLLVPP